MEIRHISEAYTDIAQDLICTEDALAHLRGVDAQIAYLSSDLEKKSNRKVVYAQCEKVPDRFKWSVPFDFTITVFEPNVERFTDEQMRILLFHELLHVGIDLDGNEEQYYIVPHDIEDFRKIINEYGLDWSHGEAEKADQAGKAERTRS